MHAIVADANTVTRVMMRNTLQRMGFRVDEVRDELGAASLMAQAEAPDLALLDFRTLRVAFGSVCAALRDIREDVYIVALIPSAHQKDIPAALAAGANDFMLHAGSIPVIEGRLRVIARLLETRYPEKAAALLTEARQPSAPQPSSAPEAPREDDSADVPGAPDPPETTEWAEPGDASETPAPPSSGAPDRKPPAEGPGRPPLRRSEEDEAPPLQPVERGYGLFDVMDFPTAVGQALRELGLPPHEPLDVVEAARDPEFAAWTLVIVRRGMDAFWCPLRLEMDRGPAEALYTAVMHRRPPDDDAVLELLRQVLDLSQEVLHDRGTASKRLQVVTPYTPHTRRAADLPVMLTSTQADRRRFGLRLNDVRLRLTVTTNVTHAQDQTLIQLRPFELLASPLMTNDRVLLLQAGVLLDEAYIEKVQALNASRGLQSTVRVFPPPSSLAIFLRRL